MSPIKTSLAVIAGLIAFATSASAEIRYAGSPKFGQFVVSPAPAHGHAMVSGSSKAFDANARMLAPQAVAPKGGIGARGI